MNSLPDQSVRRDRMSISLLLAAGLRLAPWTISMLMPAHHLLPEVYGVAVRINKRRRARVAQSVSNRRRGPGRGRDAHRLDAEVGYGLAGPRGIGMSAPYAGLEVAGEGERAWCLGARWTLAP